MKFGEAFQKMKNDFLTKISFLNQVALESIRSRSEKVVISHFTRAGIKVLEADYGFSFIKLKRSRNFKLLYKDKNTPYHPLPPRGQGLTARAFQAQKPQYIKDINSFTNARADATANMRGVVVIPISYRRANFGVIDICFYSSHQFSDEEKVLCEFIGNSTAQAITIFRLLKEKNTALEAREKFLSLASHELKTPLTSLKSFAQSLLRNAQNKIDASEDEIEALRIMERQVDRLTKLVSDILEYSGYRANFYRLKFEKVKVSLLVNEVINKLSSVLTKHVLEVDIPKNLAMKADPDRIEQVLTNIITNALKYSPTNTVIKIIARNDDQKVKISIYDQGSGITANMRERIFRPFIQVNSNLIGGMGLGLYISKQIIDRHNGRIWVESNQGKGSVFHLLLPKYE